MEEGVSNPEKLLTSFTDGPLKYSVAVCFHFKMEKYRQVYLDVYIH